MKKNIENSDMPIEQAHDVGAAQRAQAEDRERHQRVAVRELDDDEGGQERERAAPRPSVCVEVQPAPFGVDERVDEQREAARSRGRRPATSKRACPVRRGSRGSRRGASSAAPSADRHVDEEDPLPAGLLGEHAAEQDARGAARAGDGAPHAQRLVALGALAEQSW